MQLNHTTANQIYQRGDASPRYMPMEDLSKLERRLFEWIKKSDFESVPWSSQRAAEAFDVSENEILEALAALTSKIPHNIYVHYNDGAIRVAAE